MGITTPALKHAEPPNAFFHLIIIPVPTAPYTLYPSLIMTLQPSAAASLTLHAKHPLPRLDITAFQPLSAHTALARISKSLPNISCLLALARGLGDGRIGNALEVLSMQSMTRILGILLLVVCVLECAATVDEIGVDKNDSNVCC